MDWVFYIIAGLLILLAIYILYKEIRKMLKGKSCENCSGCSKKDNCSENNQIHK